jgi:dihydropyrimidinase
VTAAPSPLELDLIVRGGQVVTADTVVRADVGIARGRIAAVAAPGLLPRGAQELDAAGRLVMPGGVDAHTHIRWPYLDQTTRDDFTSATVAAAFGGTTTVIDYAVQKDAPVDECIARRRAQADGHVVVDYAFTCTLTDPSEENVRSVKRLVATGITAFKVYLIYRKRGIMVDDWMLYRVLEETRDHGAILGIHAENGPIGEGRMAQFVAEGRKSAWDFRQAKSSFLEAEAIQRAIFLAETLEAPLYIRHISTAEGVELLRAVNGRRARIFGETCPHYFTLTDEVYRRPDGHRFICSPPIKSARDRDAVHAAILDGSMHVVGGDHGAFGEDQKDERQESFDRVPNGLPGIETRLPLTYTRGVVEGGMALTRFVQLVSANPAKLFGLYPRKGTIAVGSDADLIVVDPGKERAVSPERMHLPIGWNPYTGHVLRGFPDLVLSRGDVVVDGDRCLAKPGRGTYVPGTPGGCSQV